MKQQTSAGFTIVEMMMVVVIIGVLSTIAVVGYSTWRNKTDIAVLQNDLNGVSAAMQGSQTFNNRYPLVIPVAFSPSKGVTLSGGGSVDGKTYCVTATIGSVSYHIVNGGMPLVAACS